MSVLTILEAVSPPPPDTTIVTTLSELTNALNAGNLDITLTELVTTPEGGVNVPRTGGRVLRCSGNGILKIGGSGQVLRSDGSGGRLTLSGFRVDGGWRENPHESDDGESNYFLPDYDFARIENCVSCYSLHTGYLTAGSAQVEIVNSTMFACPRDHNWDKGCNDLLVDGCLIQHCGDDSMGAHLAEGVGNTVRSMIFRNNIIRDSFGGKFHGGSATGTINGKLRQVRFENNTLEACGLYSTHGEGFNPVETTSDPTNIFFVGNTVRDMRRTTRSSGGQVINICIRLSWPGLSFNNVHIENNTFVRNTAAQGQTLQSRYTWAQLNSPDKPQNVPGAGPFQGFFDKGGFAPDEVFDLSDAGVFFDGNNQSQIFHSGNTFVGSGWTQTIT